MAHKENSHRRAREALFGKDEGRSKVGKPPAPADQSRAAQTKIIAGAIVLSAIGIVAWQEFNRDFSAMDPDSRCEYISYRMKHGWDNELQCKANFAADRLAGHPLHEDNPY